MSAPLKAKLDALQFDEEGYGWIQGRLRYKPNGATELEKFSLGLSIANMLPTYFRDRPNTVSESTITAKVVRKTLYKINVLAQFMCKSYKKSLYKANSLACFLAKPVAAALQTKSSGGFIFVTTTKIITKDIVLRNSFVIISARMVPPPPFF